MTVFAADRALLDAFRRCDRAALATVYFHYVDDVAAVIRHGFTIPATGARVRGAPDAQTERDLVQEVFARAFAPRARDAYDGIRPYRPYLRRIAKNLLIDRARAADPTVSLDDDAAELDEPVASEPEAESAEWTEQRRATVAYIATLVPELQKLVKLRFEDELSQNEVAETLGISRRRVRTLEARIHSGLRKALRRAGLAEDRLQKDRPEPALVRKDHR
jgi:RNA polymerase sigma-70 factor (ECF subfamily)